MTGTSASKAASSAAAVDNISGTSNFGDHVRFRLELLKQRVREYCLFDSWMGQRLIALLVLTIAQAFRLRGRRLRALQLEASVHRAAWSRTASAVVEGIVARELAVSAPFSPTIREYVETLSPCWRTTRFFSEPQRILRTRILAIKSYRPGEKGVLVIDYSFVFPVFARFYDLQAVIERYHLVLEPSWSGACDLDILTYAKLGHPVFVQCPEPRDAAFLQRVAPDLVPVPIAANWWTDPSVMRPIPHRIRDIDVILVSSWARFKRHERFFAALRHLQRRGIFLKAALLGYPAEITREEIAALGRQYGVLSQLEMYEWLSPAQVNEQFNRAKVNLVWSRREGCNRAIIEGFFAGVPCVLRRGFNYGHHYEYINDSTGCFSTEENLPDTLVQMVNTHTRYRTRDWALAHISPVRATAILNRTIREVSEVRGDRWTTDAVSKVGMLNTMQYLDTRDSARFEDDYRFLASVMRPSDRV